jgi:isocitrate dehydrogenase
VTDGLFHQVFDEVAEEYPDIASNHLIVDIGSARLAASPEMFDIIVTPNLYGDILSDIAAQLAGSIGLAPHAERIKNAWLCTLEDGIHTPDIYRDGLSTREVGTEEFTAAVVERLGRKPAVLQPVAYQATSIRPMGQGE